MKKRNSLFILVILLAITTIALAQKGKAPSNESDNFKGYYLGATGSTNGWGGEVKYLFNKQFTVKSGYETLKLKYDFSFEENDVDYDATMDYKTGGFYLLGDFNYTRNLYISAGALFNQFKPGISGYATSGIQYGDITIPAEMVGEFTFTIKPGLTVSPYASLGARSFFGRQKRVMLNTEIGFYYMGPPEVEIEATGLIAPTADPAHGQKERFEKQIEQYKFYPVFKLTLAVKLF